jgi:hypothetical protein
MKDRIGTAVVSKILKENRPKPVLALLIKGTLIKRSVKTEWRNPKGHLGVTHD